MSLITLQHNIHQHCCLWNFTRNSHWWFQVVIQTFGRMKFLHLFTCFVSLAPRAKPSWDAEQIPLQRCITLPLSP